jgi:hypothetical protein
MKKKAEFQWDYSYFKCQDIPAQVRREMVLARSAGGRTWIFGRTRMLIDVHNCEARKIYNENWDGCRDLWKERYRQKKLSRSEPKDPRVVEFARSCRETGITGTTSPRQIQSQPTGALRALAQKAQIILGFMFSTQREKIPSSNRTANPQTPVSVEASKTLRYSYSYRELLLEQAGSPAPILCGAVLGNQRFAAARQRANHSERHDRASDQSPRK